jgi:hypothetical protein
MLYDKTASLYTLSRNANMVSSRITWTPFSCNIQPLVNNTPNWIWWVISYNQYVLYTDNTMTLKEWDKIVSSGETYIIKDVEDWRWTLRNFLKVIMEKSRWT